MGRVLVSALAALALSAITRVNAACLCKPENASGSCTYTDGCVDTIGPGVELVSLVCVGGGGGGSYGGGSGGALSFNREVKVSSGQIFQVVVGAHGERGTAAAATAAVVALSRTFWTRRPSKTVLLYSLMSTLTPLAGVASETTCAHGGASFVHITTPGKLPGTTVVNASGGLCYTGGHDTGGPSVPGGRPGAAEGAEGFAGGAGGYDAAYCYAGGGGAGGYSGRGGDGGTGSCGILGFGDSGQNGQGGGGGGGGACGAVGGGGRGGGVGLLGQGADGEGSAYGTGSSCKPGGQGSGPGASFGGGGGNAYPTHTKYADGQPGACRIVWGAGCAYPGNAAPGCAEARKAKAHGKW